MEKICIFVANYIRKGGLLCLFVAGIFYAYSLLILGSIPPCNLVMGLLPLRCSSTGKVEPFSISTHKTFHVMNYTEECLNGQITSDSDHQAHNTGKITLTSNSTPEERAQYWQKHAETWRDLYMNSIASLTKQCELKARISELQTELSQIQTRSALAKLNEIPLREKSFTIKKQS